MKVVDERKKGTRVTLSETNISAVVQLDDRSGFWMKKYRHDVDAGCMLINLETAVTLYQPEDLEVMLVTATVTITGG